MPVYKFSHHRLAVLVHLTHTAVKWKTNFLILDVGDKLVNTDDTALMKYERNLLTSFTQSPPQRNTSDIADITSSHW